MTADTFKLVLNLGNEEIQYWYHIADALRRVADHIDGESDEQPESGDSNSIFDLNGNRVGKWETK